ncbi:hypothetical protein MRX96_059405 [Rhipicephalus microplus]
MSPIPPTVDDGGASDSRYLEFGTSNKAGEKEQLVGLPFNGTLLFVILSGLVENVALHIGQENGYKGWKLATVELIGDSKSG